LSAATSANSVWPVMAPVPKVPTSKEIPKNARILMTYGGGSIFKNGIY
jgi:hypothetical protein